MLRDGRAGADGQVLQAEVAVIGGGPAGITVARTLAAAGRSVVLVESGGTSPEAAYTALCAGDVVGEPIIDGFQLKGLADTRTRALGGSTHLWGGFCRPLRAVDFEDRPFQPVSGWPIGPADLDVHYREAQALCQLGPYDYDAGSWAAAQGTPAPIALGSELTTMLAQRNPTRFGSLYGPALAAAAEVEVVLYATTTRLAVRSGGDHVDHVELRTLNGLRHRVVADQYVVALGGIETARLLLASNDVVPAGVGNSHDLVGRHFNDHRQLASLLSPSARTRAELALYDARWTTTRPFPTPENASNTVAIQGFMELREETMRRESLPNLHLELIIEDAGSVPAQPTGVPIAAVGELLAAVGYRPGATVGANLYVESVVNRDSRVRLSPTKVDALGMPVVELDHHRLPADEAHVERGLGIFAEAFEATGLGRLQLAVGWVGFNPSPPAASGILPQLQVTPTGDRPTSPLTFGTTYHHMCTARMATDPADGVVDADGRVHETDNLHLAGSAVFPTGPGTHPTLTVVALALRLARHLDSAVLA